MKWGDGEKNENWSAQSLIKMYACVRASVCASVRVRVGLKKMKQTHMRKMSSLNP